MTPIPNRRDRIVRGVGLVGLVWCLFVLAFDWGPAITKCGEDTSGCARTQEKNGLYRGVLLDPQDRPRANTTFFVKFESRRDARPRSVRFTTDARGRYCIVWAEETVIPFVHLGDESEASTEDEPWQSLYGAKPPRECQRGAQGIPGDRADNTTDTPRHEPVPALGLLGGLLFLLVIVRGAAPPARILLTAGLGVTLANTLIAAFL